MQAIAIYDWSSHRLFCKYLLILYYCSQLNVNFFDAIALSKLDNISEYF